jgi:predicted ATPase
VLTPYSPQQNRKAERWQALIRQIQNATQNVDNSPLNLQQAIAELSDDQRRVLFALVTDLLGAVADIRFTIPDNSMSQKYIEVDGYNLSFSSSGFGLVTTLLTSLLNRDYTHFLVDEPELGLSPEIQGVFADWLLDPAKRSEYLGHIAGVTLATHSPVFLDRKNIQNKVIVDRVGTEITLRRVESIQELNSLQFRLLGNRFETMFLPSVILLVEGKTDHAYLTRILSLRKPQSTVSVIHTSSDARMREVMAIARQMLGDVTRSPYSQRIFAVLDSRHGHGLVDQLVQMGIKREHVVVWEGNGIEYVYPRKLLERRFGQFSDFTINGDIVIVNGHSVTKQELNNYVVNNLRGEEELPQELMEKLLTPLEAWLF